MKYRGIDERVTMINTEMSIVKDQINKIENSKTGVYEGMVTNMHINGNRGICDCKN